MSGLGPYADVPFADDDPSSGSYAVAGAGTLYLLGLGAVSYHVQPGMPATATAIAWATTAPGYSIVPYAAHLFRLTYAVPGTDTFSFGFMDTSDPTGYTQWVAAPLIAELAVLNIGSGQSFVPGVGATYQILGRIPTKDFTIGSFIGS